MSELRTPSTGADQRGTTPVGGERRGGRKKGLLIGALLLAALLGLALLLSQCGTDPTGSAGGTADDSAAADPSDPGSSDSGSSDPGASGAGSDGAGSDGAGSASGGAGAAAGRGAITTAGGQSVLDLVAGAEAAGALGSVSGQAATATGVRVLSVPADEGFWVGSSDTQRVWVQLTGEAGESPYQVAEGDTVDFEATVVPHDPSFAGQVGVDEAEGATQLNGQGQHLEAAKSAVRLSS